MLSEPSRESGNLELGHGVTYGNRGATTAPLFRQLPAGTSVTEKQGPAISASPTPACPAAGTQEVCDSHQGGARCQMSSIHIDELFLSRRFPLTLLLRLPSFFTRVFDPKSEICQRLKARHAGKAPLLKCLGSGGCRSKSSVLALRNSPLRTGYQT